MTILEALKSKVSYPLSDSFFQSVLIERGLSTEGDFTQEVAQSKEFKLCYADALIRMISGVNATEGDYSVSLSDRDNLLKIANTIYSKYGEPEFTELRPTVTYREDWE